jgi:hypothetical protein
VDEFDGFVEGGVMRWDTLPRRFYPNLRLRHGVRHHEFSQTEMHVLIGFGALAAVAMILGFLAWSFK